MTVCYVFRPDHNGECLTCDEWFDAHPTPLDRVLQRELTVWERRVRNVVETRPHMLVPTVRFWLRLVFLRTAR